MRIKKIRTHDYVQVEVLALKDASEEAKKLFKDGTFQQLRDFDATASAAGIAIAISDTDELLIPWTNVKEIIRVKEPKQGK